MSRKKRKIKPTIFIFCEGLTEEYYLNGLIEDIEGINYSYDVILVDSKYNDALNLVNEALKKQNEHNYEYDQFWVVFDKNGYTKHSEAFHLAGSSSPKINIGFSSISFEHWVLLHFEKNNTAFPKANDVITHLIKSNYYPGYEKGDGKLYEKLKAHTDTAIENSSWLKCAMKSYLKKGDKLFQLNPYTTFDQLVCILLERTTSIIYYDVDDEISLNNIVIKILNYKIVQDILEISVNIKNQNDRSYVFNNNVSFFNLFDENDKISFRDKTETKIIQPNEESEIKISYKITNLNPPFKIIYNDGAIKVVISLL